MLSDDNTDVYVEMNTVMNPNSSIPSIPLNDITFQLIIYSNDQIANLSDNPYIYVFDNRTNKYYKIAKSKFVEKYFSNKLCEYVTFQGNIKDLLTDITIPQRQNIWHLWSKKIDPDVENLKNTLNHIVEILNNLSSGKDIITYPILKTDNDVLSNQINWSLIIHTKSIIKDYDTSIVINSNQPKIFIKSNRQDTLPSFSVFSLSYTISNIDSDIEIPIVGNDEITEKIKHILNIVINTLSIN